MATAPRKGYDALLPPPPPPAPPPPHVPWQSAGGLGVLCDEELAEGAEIAWEQKENLAVQRENDLRATHAQYLSRRKAVLVTFMVLYVAAVLGIPFLHRDEVSCSEGYFWETHMLFFALFLLMKLSELWFVMVDKTVDVDLSVMHLLMTFGPSFFGYLDAYTDSDSFFVAAACDTDLARVLAIGMAASFVVGVLLAQWVVMFYFALQDPSHACLLKLLHMDLLASCISLPPEQKWTWDTLALVRTVGEDIPQASLQTIYLLTVKKNAFMLLSVCVAVASSLKALYDARNRRLVAQGLVSTFEKRERDLLLYSVSVDATIRCWDLKTNNCKKIIDIGESAKCIAATGGMLYSSHDDGFIREWSPDSGLLLRQFHHPETNVLVKIAEDKAYSWAYTTFAHELPVYTVWDLVTGRQLRKLPGARAHLAAFDIVGDNFFCAADDHDSNVKQWSVKSGALLYKYQGHTGQINALFATKRRLLTGSMDGTVKEWDLQTQQCTRTFGDHCTDYHAPLLVHKNNLMYNCSSRNPKLINELCLETGEVNRQFAGHTDKVLSLAMFAGNMYSSSADMTIKQWSLESGECLKTFEGHTSPVNSIVVEHRDDVWEFQRSTTLHLA
eukprot:TRINITY_DN21156_c0_g1_i2.p1 TRINITY_DN21156_c0_g1~~TRINITY_DN21156_c0_g1_i2.p1  ORF type:complete len:613 (+),score=83.67 TRINITY_DN21156_c0_g1_i2:59-1897(+)